MQYTNNVFDIKYIPFERMEILSEVFPNLVDNKEVIVGDNVN
jgi:hypothetical protein